MVCRKTPSEVGTDATLEGGDVLTDEVDLGRVDSGLGETNDLGLADTEVEAGRLDATFDGAPFDTSSDASSVDTSIDSASDAATDASGDTSDVMADVMADATLRNKLCGGGEFRVHPVSCGATFPDVYTPLANSWAAKTRQQGIQVSPRRFTIFSLGARLLALCRHGIRPGLKALPKHGSGSLRPRSSSPTTKLRNCKRRHGIVLVKAWRQGTGPRTKPTGSRQET